MLLLYQFTTSCQFFTNLLFLCLKGIKAACFGHFFESQRIMWHWLRTRQPISDIESKHHPRLNMYTGSLVSLGVQRCLRLCCLGFGIRVMLAVKIVLEKCYLFYFWKSLNRIGVNSSFKCSVEFTSEVFWSWTSPCWENLMTDCACLFVMGLLIFYFFSSPFW